MTPYDYIQDVPRDLLTSTAGRKVLTRNDPMMFAIVYELHHLIRQGDTEASLAQFHIDITDYAKSWTTNEGRRDCWIAPRSSGKSTWLFTLLPLWAAAHGHKKFIAAFSDSEDQASRHLQSFKNELDTNELLKKDYPELCTPKMGGGVKRYIAQSNTMIQQSNGFSFSAKGVDSKSLGLKIGNNRPDLILLDDIEPTESNYSPHLAETRKRTMLDGIFLLNDRAAIAIVGTTTMSNSVLDQIRKVGEYATTYRSSSKESEITELVNNDLLKQTVVNASADTIYYVSLTRGTLSDAKAITGVSMEPGGIEESISHPVANACNNSALDDIEPILFISQIDETAPNMPIMSSSTKLPIAECIDTESLPLQELTTTDSDQLLTKVGEHESGKNDFKSSSSFSGTSIPNSFIANFETLQAQQLEQLGSKTNVNKGEYDLEQTQIESVSFYDSLDQDLQWVLDEKIHVHYYPAIITNADGTESSWWPEYKPLEELNEIRHTRSFAMNYMNRPVNVDAEYWRESDIQIGECVDGYVRTLISVDPAVSTKQSNDYTALCVVSLGEDGLIYVRHAEQVRYVSVELKDRVNELVDSFDAGLVLVETNQGGMLWSSVFDGVQANYKSIHQTEPKPVRAGRALDYYRKNKVRHTRHFAELEEQMYSYPKVTHDDLLDAMGTGIHYFLSASNRPRVKRRSYI